MITTLDIVIWQNSIGSCTEQTHSLYDFGKDYILPLIFCITAAIVAYYIFVVETKRDKKIEAERKITEYNDKLLFFFSLLESVIKTSSQQNDHIKVHIDKIEENDLEFHLLTILINNNLKRISSEINLEDYSLAYAYRYNNSKVSISEFNEIITSVDFLYTIFSSFDDFLKRSYEIDIEQKLKLQVIFKEAYDEAGNLLIKLIDTSDSRKGELQDIFNNFMKNNKGSSEISFYYDTFILPINDFCVNNITTNEKVAEMKNVALLTRDCKQVYNQIKSNNQASKDLLISDHDVIKKEIQNLKNISKKFLNEYNSTQ